MKTGLSSALALAIPFALLTACGGGDGVQVAESGLATKAISIDSQGHGFVGKGDVQYTFGLNNKQLQDVANTVQFQHIASTVTEASWICTNSNNQNTQERERTTTTETTGVLTSVARDNKKQVTGFMMNGFAAGSVSSSSTEGPALNSCPTNWVLTPAGAPETISDSAEYEVKYGTLDWTKLLEAPTTTTTP